jgi:hypothetical protein
MKDLGLNAGYVAWWGKVASEDAHVLQVLWDAGAVFHTRTTQPQSMMHLETDSNLYGVTVNPYNRNVSAGGSSGGEGALIGMRGSCLGIGSDIGGRVSPHLDRVWPIEHIQVALEVPPPTVESMASNPQHFESRLMDGAPRWPEQIPSPV